MTDWTGNLKEFITQSTTFPFRGTSSIADTLCTSTRNCYLSSFNIRHFGSSNWTAKTSYNLQTEGVVDNIKGSFGSHHLGLESRNSFVIPEITCLAATELVTEFILNSMIFIPCLILIPLWYPVISVALPNKLISSCHFILFIPNEMKWWMPNEP
jgi:hypothetical protein